MEKCRTCNALKPWSEFYRHPNYESGYFPKCKTCLKLKAKRHYITNREHKLRQMKPMQLLKEEK